MKKLILFLLMAVVINGCEQSSNTTIKKPLLVQHYAKPTQLEGLVSDGKNPIKQGVVQAQTLSGQIITEVTLNNSAQYQLTIPENTALPLLLKFQASNNNTKALFTAVIHPHLTHYDLNPLTTQIAQTAQSYGGYTHTNMVRAAENTVHVPDANKTTTGWRGDPTTQYGGWH